MTLSLMTLIYKYYCLHVIRLSLPQTTGVLLVIYVANINPIFI